MRTNAKQRADWGGVYEGNPFVADLIDDVEELLKVIHDEHWRRYVSPQRCHCVYCEQYQASKEVGHAD